MVRSFVLALFATLLVWGRGLSSSETFTPSALTKTISPRCRAGGPHLTCMAPIRSLGLRDSGSPAWVSSPTSYFLQHARQNGEPRPQWNPYDGSGYPLELDGHSSRFSPTEWFLSHVPGDQGQDILIFVRFLLWTFALVWALALFEKDILPLAAMAIVATMAPYGAGYGHIVFLDADLLGPWFLLLLMLLVRGHIRLPAALAGSLALGLLASTLGFPQARLVLLTAMGLLALLAAPITKCRSLLLAAALAVGLFLVVPSWLPMLTNLDQMVSSRTVGCVSEQSVGWRAFVEDLLHLPLRHNAQTTVTLAGLALLPLVRRRFWFVSVTVVLLGLVLALGLPHKACALPVISGLRFSRHLLPHLQMLFLFAAGLAINHLGQRLDRGRSPLFVFLPVSLAAFYVVNVTLPTERTRTIWWCVLCASALVLLAAHLPWTSTRWRGLRRNAFALALMGFVFPGYVVGAELSVRILHGQATTAEIPPLPSVIEPSTPLGKVQELSRDQDRRHYSPSEWIYPNWSQALGILDMRSLNALYPLGIHELNAGLFSHWERDPAHVLNPDRFTTTVPAEQYRTTEFQRVMALHRVSLLTFSIGGAIFPGGPGPYEAAKCRLLAADPAQGTESYLCPEVGGVGYFPEIVTKVACAAEALEIANRMSPADLLKVAFLGPELDSTLGPSGPAVAKGQVISMARSANHLLYWLWVEKPGTFVVADAYFRGWTATVNGKPTEISRANVAFKAVQVPQGFVDLHFHFQVTNP